MPSNIHYEVNLNVCSRSTILIQNYWHTYWHYSINKNIKSNRFTNIHSFQFCIVIDTFVLTEIALPINIELKNSNQVAKFLCSSLGKSRPFGPHLWVACFTCSIPSSMLSFSSLFSSLPFIYDVIMPILFWSFIRPSLSFSITSQSEHSRLDILDILMSNEDLL